MLKNICFILIAGFYLNHQVLFADGKWQLEKKKNGISVYSKEIAEERINAFRAIATFNYDMERIFEVLRTPHDYPKWLEKSKMVQVLDSSDSSKTFFMEVVVPFPFLNRELIQKISFDRSDRAIRIAMTNKADLLPENAGRIRLKNAGGYWLLEETHEGTRVTFEFFMDPEGIIPGWLANTFLINGPYKNLLGLQQFLATMQKEIAPVSE